MAWVATLAYTKALTKYAKNTALHLSSLLCVPYINTEFGRFLRFEPLTMCPIDTTPIIKNMLSAEETACLNAYHAMVYDRLAPHLDDEYRTWLWHKTREI